MALGMALPGCDDESYTTIDPLMETEESRAPDEQSSAGDSAAADTASFVRFLALGDSYTIGEGVPSGERWPVQLAGRLRELNIPVDQPQIIARTGWTTENLLFALKNSPPDPDYQIVSLLIGVNNQYQGRSITEYEQQFGQLLDSAVFYAGMDKDRVIVLSIPDYGVTPFGQSGDPERIKNEIDAFNLVNKTITGERNILYFNITEISRQAAGDPSLLAPDQLHPSGKMYSLWIDLMIARVAEILSK